MTENQNDQLKTSLTAAIPTFVVSKGGLSGRRGQPLEEIPHDLIGHALQRRCIYAPQPPLPPA
jgi:hypothetical protein